MLENNNWRSRHFKLDMFDALLVKHNTVINIHTVYFIFCLIRTHIKWISRQYSHPRWWRKSIHITEHSSSPLMISIPIIITLVFYYLTDWHWVRVAMTMYVMLCTLLHIRGFGNGGFNAPSIGSQSLIHPALLHTIWTFLAYTYHLEYLTNIVHQLTNFHLPIIKTFLWTDTSGAQHCGHICTCWSAAAFSDWQSIKVN